MYAYTRCVAVYRRPGKQYMPYNFRPRISFDGGSMWARISLEGCTKLFSLPGARLTVVRYITDILEPHVIPYAPVVGGNLF